MLDLSSLDLGEIATALADQTDYEHHWLINPGTGEIVFWTADTGINGQTPVDLDELDLIVIEPLPSWVWYQDMADFVNAIIDERARRRLARALQGKGAFRRFKDELHEEHPGRLPAWYAFRDTRASRRAVQWLADSTISRRFSVTAGFYRTCVIDGLLESPGREGQGTEVPSVTPADQGYLLAGTGPAGDLTDGSRCSPRPAAPRLLR